MNPGRCSWWETRPFCGCVKAQPVLASLPKRAVTSHDPEMGDRRCHTTFDPRGFRNKEVTHALTIASPGNGTTVWVYKAQEQIPEASPKLISGKWFPRVAYVLQFIWIVCI